MGLGHFKGRIIRLSFGFRNQSTFLTPSKYQKSHFWIVRSKKSKIPFGVRIIITMEPIIIPKESVRRKIRCFVRCKVDGRSDITGLLEHLESIPPSSVIQILNVSLFAWSEAINQLLSMKQRIKTVDTISCKILYASREKSFWMNIDFGRITEIKCIGDKFKMLVTDSKARCW